MNYFKLDAQALRWLVLLVIVFAAIAYAIWSGVLIEEIELPGNLRIKMKPAVEQPLLDPFDFDNIAKWPSVTAAFNQECDKKLLNEYKKFTDSYQPTYFSSSFYIAMHIVLGNGCVQGSYKIDFGNYYFLVTTLTAHAITDPDGSRFICRIAELTLSSRKDFEFGIVQNGETVKEFKPYDTSKQIWCLDDGVYVYNSDWEDLDQGWKDIFQSR
jgi:hypothetical protein